MIYKVEGGNCDIREYRGNGNVYRWSRLKSNGNMGHNQGGY